MPAAATSAHRLLFLLLLLSARLPEAFLPSACLSRLPSHTGITKEIVGTGGEGESSAASLRSAACPPPPGETELSGIFLSKPFSSSPANIGEGAYFPSSTTTTIGVKITYI